jgi:hypothetical protein
MTAQTINFGDIKGDPGLPVMPFLEASKAMARGIGYGGEGDVLTAAFLRGSASRARDHVCRDVLSGLGWRAVKERDGSAKRSPLLNH